MPVCRWDLKIPGYIFREEHGTHSHKEGYCSENGNRIGPGKNDLWDGFLKGKQAQRGYLSQRMDHPCPVFKRFTCREVFLPGGSGRIDGVPTDEEIFVNPYVTIPILLAQQQPEGLGIGAMLLPMLVIGVLFYFLLIVPQRKEQRKRQEMLAGLKKNDRVITIGGIYGVVANVHREADEVTLKVDEATNTKIRFSLSAIARVLGEGPSEENK